MLIYGEAHLRAMRLQGLRRALQRAPAAQSRNQRPPYQGELIVVLSRAVRRRKVLGGVINEYRPAA